MFSGQHKAWVRTVGSLDLIESWGWASDQHILNSDANDLLWEEDGELDAQLEARFPCSEPNATHVQDGKVYREPIYKLPVETVLAMVKASGKPVRYATSNYGHSDKILPPFRQNVCWGYTIVSYDPKGFKKAAQKEKADRVRKPILMHEITKCIHDICALLPEGISRKFAWMYSDHSTKSGRMSQLMFILTFIDLAYGKNKHRALAPFIKLVKEWRIRYAPCQRLVSDSQKFVDFMNETAKKRLIARPLGKPKSPIVGVFE